MSVPDGFVRPVGRIRSYRCIHHDEAFVLGSAGVDRLSFHSEAAQSWCRSEIDQDKAGGKWTGPDRQVVLPAALPSDHKFFCCYYKERSNN